MSKTRGVHARDHSHDVGNIGCCWDEVVEIAGQRNLEWLLRRYGLLLDGLRNVSSLVQNVIVATE